MTPWYQIFKIIILTVPDILLIDNWHTLLSKRFSNRHFLSVAFSFSDIRNESCVYTVYCLEYLLTNHHSYLCSNTNSKTFYFFRFYHAISAESPSPAPKFYKDIWMGGNTNCELNVKANVSNVNCATWMLTAKSNSAFIWAVSLLTVISHNINTNIRILIINPLSHFLIKVSS